LGVIASAEKRFFIAGLVREAIQLCNFIFLISEPFADWIASRTNIVITQRFSALAMTRVLPGIYHFGTRFALKTIKLLENRF